VWCLAVGVENVPRYAYNHVVEYNLHCIGKKNCIFNSPNLNVVLTTFEDDCGGDGTAKCIDIIFQTALAAVIMHNNYVVVLLHKIYIGKCM